MTDIDTSSSTACAECLCGAVRLHATFPSLWVAHCHCTRCRHAHGAAFVTWVGFHEHQVRIEDARQQLRWFTYPESGAERGFCARCGSSLLFRSPRWAGELHLTVANFRTALDRAPQAHVFHDTAVHWFEVNDALPKKSAIGPG